MRRFAESEGGASAVEFAIVGPVFILMLLGTLAFGLYIGVSHSVAQLSADAARASIAGLDDAERASIARQYVERNASGFPLVDAGRITVEAGPAPTDSTAFRVVVSYDASSLPIWQLQNFLPLPEQTVKRVSVVRRGGE
ncbi:MAG: pilus assembly protein [Hyphomicrobiaceae bacterium]|nr:pilus assembly protein [Hyphomicrobiaceae bacterium]